MPRFLGRLTGVSFQTELLMMTLFGLANSTLEWSSFNWTQQVEQIQGLCLSRQVGGSNTEYWLKTVLSWVVIARIFIAHLHTCSYLTNFYSILTWSRPQLLLPWMIISFFKNFLLDGIVLCVGIFVWYEGNISTALLGEFLIVKVVPFVLAVYNWYSTLGFSKELRKIEKLRKIRRVIMGKDSDFGRKLKIGPEAENDGSGTSLLKKQRCVSFLSFNDFYCQTSLDSLVVDPRISRSLTTLLTVSSTDSEEMDEAALQIIEDPDLTPIEKSMKILGITEEDVRNSRAKSRYTLTERFDRSTPKEDHQMPRKRKDDEGRIIWREDGHMQTSDREYQPRKRKRRDDWKVEEQHGQMRPVAKEPDEEEKILTNQDLVSKKIDEKWRTRKEKQEETGAEAKKKIARNIEDEGQEKKLEFQKREMKKDDEGVRVKAEDRKESESSGWQRSKICQGKKQRKYPPRHPCDPFVQRQQIISAGTPALSAMQQRITTDKYSSNGKRVCECSDKEERHKKQEELPRGKSKNQIFSYKNQQEKRNSLKQSIGGSNWKTGKKEEKDSRVMADHVDDLIEMKIDKNMFFCSDIKLDVGTFRWKNILRDSKLFLPNKFPTAGQLFPSINEQFKANFCSPLGSDNPFLDSFKFSFPSAELYKEKNGLDGLLQQEALGVQYLLRKLEEDFRISKTLSESITYGGCNYSKTNSSDDVKAYFDYFHDLNSIDFNQPNGMTIKGQQMCPLLWPTLISQGTQFEKDRKKSMINDPQDVQNPGDYLRKDICTQVSTVRRSRLPMKFQKAKRHLSMDHDGSLLKNTKSSATSFNDKQILKSEEIHQTSPMKDILTSEFRENFENNWRIDVTALKSQHSREHLPSYFKKMALLSKPPAYPKKIENKVKRKSGQGGEWLQEKSTNVRLRPRPRRIRSQLESVDQREAMELKALRAYNKITLLQDKRQLEAKRGRHLTHNGNKANPEIVHAQKDLNKKFLDKSSMVDKFPEFPVRSGEEITVEDRVNDPGPSRVRSTKNVMSFNISEDNDLLSKLWSIDSRSAKIILDLLDRYDSQRLKDELKMIQDTRNNYSKHGSLRKNLKISNNSPISLRRVENIQAGRELNRNRVRQNLVPEENHMDTTKSYRNEIQNILSTVSSGSSGCEAEEILSQSSKSTLSFLRQSSDDSEDLRRSITGPNLREIIRDIVWTFHSDGIVLLNKNLQQRSLNPETLHGFYQGDIVDGETTSLLHAAFFFRPEIIMRTIRFDGSSEETGSTLRDIVNGIHREPSVDEFGIQLSNEMIFRADQGTLDSGLNHVRMDQSELGLLMMRALQNFQGSDQNLCVVIIEGDDTSPDTSRIGSIAPDQDLNVEEVENSGRQHCVLMNEVGETDSSKENYCIDSMNQGNFPDLPVNFLVELLKGIEISQQSHSSNHQVESQLSIEYKIEEDKVSEQMDQRIADSLSNVVEEPITNGLSFPITIKGSDAGLDSFESFPEVDRSIIPKQTDDEKNAEDDTVDNFLENESEMESLGKTDELSLTTILFFMHIVLMFHLQYFIEYFHRVCCEKSTKSTFTSTYYEINTVSTSTSRLFEFYTEIPDNLTAPKRSLNQSKNAKDDQTSTNSHSEEILKDTNCSPRSILSINSQEKLGEGNLVVANIFSRFIDSFFDIIEDDPYKVRPRSDNFCTKNQDYERQRSFYLLETVIDLEEEGKRDNFLPRIPKNLGEVPEGKQECNESVPIVEAFGTNKENGLVSNNSRETAESDVIKASNFTEPTFEDNDSYDSIYTRNSAASGNGIVSVECSSMEEFANNTSRTPSQDSETESTGSK